MPTKPKSKRAESATFENTTPKKNSVTFDKDSGSKARQLLAKTLWAI